MALGIAQTQANLTDADIFYSLSITSTGASDVGTLDLTDGTVAQSVGTPTITDGDGNDFEGVTLVALVQVYAIYIAFDEVAAGTITMASGDTDLPDCVAREDGQLVQVVYPTGRTISVDTIAFTFDDASSQKVTITVAGKSS
jgi:hypothetical protein